MGRFEVSIPFGKKCSGLLTIDVIFRPYSRTPSAPGEVPPPGLMGTKATSLYRISEVIMTRKNESGQALIFGVVALGLLLLGFAGLGIDIGYMRYEKRLQQTAADNAALSGAAELGFGAGDVNPAGQHGAALDGFTDGTNNVTVTINNPPTLGPHKGDSSYVEAYVAKIQPTFFMKALGVTSEMVTARAVAYWGSGIANSCVFTLGNPGNGIQGISVSGTPTLNAPTCGIDDNGNFRSNGKKLDVNAGTIGVVGTDTNNGGGTITCSGSSTNCPVTGIAPAGDPLGYLMPPAVGAPVPFMPASITPGTTYSSISITGGTVNFPAGTYIVDGNMTINGNSTVTGTDVTFYITGGGSVTINGTTNVQFKAPTTGTYAGILFYQDPNDTSSAKINGTSSSIFQGALYFPSASLDFSGTGTTFNSGAAYTVIVSDALVVNGTATVDINSDFSSLPGGSPIHTTVLVE